MNTNKKCIENKEIVESLNKTTAFLGAAVDEVNGPSDERIRVALNNGHRLLTIQEFIEVTRFTVDPVMVNYFWQVVVGKQCSHLTPLLLQWFGYEGEDYTKKQLFIRMLKRNNIPYKELKHTDEEVNLYPTIKEEMALLPHQGAIALAKWLVMEPNDIKRAIMKLNTKNGDSVRNYYINLEELIQLYAEYCLYFTHREAQRKISNLEQLMADMKLQMNTVVTQNNELINQNNELLGQNDGLLERVEGVQESLDVVQDRLDIAVEDRAPRVRTNACRERFVLFRKNDGTPCVYPYYVIRGQKGYCDRTIAKYTGIYPKLTIIVDLSCQPNPRNLYIRFRERHISLKSKDKIRFKTDGNNISLNGHSEDILVDILTKLNEEKYDV